jgi:hypothetical protein
MATLFGTGKTTLRMPEGNSNVYFEGGVSKINLSEQLRGPGKCILFL